MSLNVLDLEELHTPETRTEECEVKKGKNGNGFICRVFLILGLLNYKKCSPVPRIRIWMILVGALLCLERGIAIRRLISKSIFDKEDIELSDHEACFRRETKRKQLKSRPVSQDFIWLLLVVL
ncbi:Protein CBG26221 [Caenorhabditis briggsae]|uniref:Protein CBG26221 n=1 Tax=Caenorhabditis briggsae TaxID=6238 RepID=B6IEM9_CAEBR|nr:Protein CBG26221 [Caenorhabditis briggsae]CAR98359.1 Protein CBG26221 [Caenorhabditis briggsae]